MNNMSYKRWNDCSNINETTHPLYDQGHVYLFTINANNKNFKDDDMIDMVKWFKLRINKDFNNYIVFINIDISQNHIQSTGFNIIMEAINDLASICFLKQLKAYKNDITDDGLKQLNILFSRQKIAVEEVHLSHNFLSYKGAHSLLKSISYTKDDKGVCVYPRNGKIPLWLRLEHNSIENVDELIHDFERTLCLAIRKNTMHGCSPQRCSQKSPKQIHVYCLNTQRVDNEHTHTNTHTHAHTHIHTHIPPHTHTHLL
eukprot:GHVR01052957.1.p1 GENE.GHVR01052957.1~~GHVR01052957.1.p1  ORF type:complete len:257 (+),score=89.21 GHVR01052957.1:43-813(+)